MFTCILALSVSATGSQIVYHSGMVAAPNNAFLGWEIENTGTEVLHYVVLPWSNETKDLEPLASGQVEPSTQDSGTKEESSEIPELSSNNEIKRGSKNKVSGYVPGADLNGRLYHLIVFVPSKDTKPEELLASAQVEANVENEKTGSMLNLHYLDRYLATLKSSRPVKTSVNASLSVKYHQHSGLAH